MSGRADRFCGVHFFNPVMVLPLVEIIKTKDTTDRTFNAFMRLAKLMMKVLLNSMTMSASCLSFSYYSLLRGACNAKIPPGSLSTACWCPTSARCIRLLNAHSRPFHPPILAFMYVCDALEKSE